MRSQAQAGMAFARLPPLRLSPILPPQQRPTRPTDRSPLRSSRLLGVAPRLGEGPPHEVIPPARKASASRRSALPSYLPSQACLPLAEPPRRSEPRCPRWARWMARTVAPVEPRRFRSLSDLPTAGLLAPSATDSGAPRPGSSSRAMTRAPSLSCEGGRLCELGGEDRRRRARRDPRPRG